MAQRYHLGLDEYLPEHEDAVDLYLCHLRASFDSFEAALDYLATDLRIAPESLLAPHGGLPPPIENAMDKTPTAALAEQLSRLDAAMQDFYTQDFSDEAAERACNKTLKQALLALAGNALRQGGQPQAEQALRILAQHTGCQEDLEILAEIMDSPDGRLLAAFPPCQTLLANAAAARWDGFDHAPLEPPAPPASDAIRQRQLYAASCLQAFCQAQALSHPAIAQLLSHLYAIEHATSLPAWESEGAGLALNGRGDPPPAELARWLADQDLRDSFLQLVDCVVEVGLADLYGADTAMPAGFIQRIEAILLSHAVALPTAPETKA